jgi:hypothetical protein
MASLDDILTAAKNIVVALNTANSSNAIGFASSSSLNLSTTTQVGPNAGRLYSVLVTTAGTTAGALYDSASTSTISASDLIANIPNTSGWLIEFNWPYKNGLVFVPGSGMVVNITYT